MIPTMPRDATPASTMPLLLWPGLAADARLFATLIELRPRVHVPPFIEPEPNESLRGYARRYADQLTPMLPEDGRYAIGGFSFGGQLAQELAAVLDPAPRGIVLICGVRGRHQILPGFVRQQRLGALVPASIAKLLYVPFARRFARQESLDQSQTDCLVAMAGDIDPAFLKWSSTACAQWPGPPAIEASIRHIHGELDRIIPDVKQEADVTIEGAGHLITLTHPAQIAEFIDVALTKFDADSRA